jgi:hypothetical protein
MLELYINLEDCPRRKFHRAKVQLQQIKHAAIQCGMKIAIVCCNICNNLFILQLLTLYLTQTVQKTISTLAAYLLSLHSITQSLVLTLTSFHLHHIPQPIYHNHQQQRVYYPLHYYIISISDSIK